MARNHKFVREQKVREFEFACAVIVSNVSVSNKLQNMDATEMSFDEG